MMNSRGHQDDEIPLALSTLQNGTASVLSSDGEELHNNDAPSVRAKGDDGSSVADHTLNTDSSPSLQLLFLKSNEADMVSVLSSDVEELTSKNDAPSVGANDDDGSGVTNHTVIKDKFPALKLLPAYLTIFSYFFSLYMVLPFLPFMTKDFVDRPRNELGYYAGFLASAFSLGDFFGSTIWGRLADRYGRRPILLISSLGSSVFVVLFGVSMSFNWAVLARLGWGTVGSIMGVAKALLGELSTDSTRARIFAGIGIANGLAALVGPGLSSLLYKPSRKYAQFDTPFWRGHPYLLPCLIVVGVNLFNFLLSLRYLEETLPAEKRRRSSAGLSRAGSSQSSVHGRYRQTNGIGHVQLNSSPSRRDDKRDFFLQDEYCIPETTEVNSEKESLTAGSNGADLSLQTDINDRVAALAEHDKDSAENDSTEKVDNSTFARRLRSRWIGSRHGNAYQNLSKDVQTERTVRFDNDVPDSQDNADVTVRSGRGCALGTLCSGLWRGLLSYFSILYCLRVRTIRLVVTSYFIIALTGMMMAETLPLLMVNDFGNGGFCFNSSEIGVFNSATAFFQLFSQAFVYPWLARRLGYRRLYMTVIVVFAVSCILTPLSVSIVGSQDPLPRPPVNESMPDLVHSLSMNSSKYYTHPPPSAFNFTGDGTVPKQCYVASDRRWTSYNTSLLLANLTTPPLPSSPTPPVLPPFVWNYTVVALDQCGRLSEEDVDQLPVEQRISDVKYLDCLDWWVWPVLMLLRMPLNSAMIMAFTCANVFVNNASDNKSRASVVSVGQMAASVARVFGPLISIMFAWTTTNHLFYPLNYHLTFWLMAIITASSVWVIQRLPASIEVMGPKPSSPTSLKKQDTADYSHHDSTLRFSLM